MNNTIPPSGCSAYGLLIVLSAVVLSGCSLVQQGFHTNISEPLQYWCDKDLHRTRKSNLALANDAWDEIESQLGDEALGADYRDGFVEGYADYLTYGGNALPPLVPPRRYWNLKPRSVIGQSYAESWLAGFAAGADAARRSGLRETTVIRSTSVSDCVHGANDSGIASRRCRSSAARGD